MVLIAMSIAFNFALRIFWYHGNHSNMCISLLGLYILDPAMSAFICSSEFLAGGMNDPMVYTLLGVVFEMVLVIIFNWECYLGDSFWWEFCLCGFFSMHWKI